MNLLLSVLLSLCVVQAVLEVRVQAAAGGQGAGSAGGQGAGCCWR